MKRIATLLAAGALALSAQQLQLNFGQLAAKASDSVDLSLNGATLQFAARFLDDKDGDEARVKKLISGLEGIYVRSFEFNKDGVWTQADLDAVRNQLRAPAWSRIVGYKSHGDNETSEVYVRYENKKITGIAILAVEPREFTVVNIAGPVDLDSLADLSGHFGVPKLERKPTEKKQE